MKKTVSIFSKENCSKTSRITLKLKALLSAHKWNVVDGSQFVIAVGGDGTLLRAAHAYPNSTPTILPIHTGSLGFMLPFGWDEASSLLSEKEPLSIQKLPTLTRQRLSIRILNPPPPPLPHNNANGTDAHRDRKFYALTALNEVILGRGPSPHLAMIDCCLDGNLLTKAIADGLLVSTSTGSTAYSLSAGGPIIHPAINSLLLTPIAPRSLSFRPILLPSTCQLSMKTSKESRATPLHLSIDSNDPISISDGQSVQVTASPWPIKVLCKSHSVMDDWMDVVKRLLSWNQKFVRD